MTTFPITFVALIIEVFFAFDHITNEKKRKKEKERRRDKKERKTK